MILTNLTKAIREQNYYAVVLEFLIVIAGVVIGFQVTSWNEQRNIQRTADNTIINMRNEFREISRVSEMRTNFHFDAVRIIEEFIVCLDTGCDEQTLDVLVPKYVSTAGGVYTLPPRSSTYAELIGSGRISLIENAELRMALFNVDTAISNAEDANTRNTLTMINHESVARAHIEYGVEPGQTSIYDGMNFNDPSFSVDTILPSIRSYDWEAMRNDPGVRFSAMELHRSQTFNALNHSTVLATINEVIQILEESG